MIYLTVLLGLAQRIIESQTRVTRDAEDVLNVVGLEHFDDELTAIESHTHPPLLASWADSRIVSPLAPGLGKAICGDSYVSL